MTQLAPKRSRKVKPSRPQAKLIIISGPSGVGKTTLCDRLLAEFPQLYISISTTTRPARSHEKEGVDYFFVSRNDFQTLRDKGAFAEWARVHDHFYGTRKSTVNDALKQGRCVLFNIDVQGAQSLYQHYGEDCVLIFISPPSLQELEHRLRDRGDESASSIAKRLKDAYTEIQSADFFQHHILNDELERAYRELKDLVGKICGITAGKQHKPRSKT